MKRSPRRWGRLLGAVAVTGGVALGPLTGLSAGPAQAQSDGGDGVRVIGEVSRPRDNLDPPITPGRAMAVDDERNLGFVVNRASGALGIDLVDLERLTAAGSIADTDLPNGSTPERNLALDTRRARLYRVGVFQSNAECRANDAKLRTFDYGTGADGRRRMVADRIEAMPCSGPIRFNGLTLFFYRDAVAADQDRLYVGGAPGTEGWRTSSNISPLPHVLGGTLEEDRGQALLVRQVALRGEGFCGPVVANQCSNPDVTRPVLEWEVDLRLAGCGRRERVGQGSYEGFVARSGTEVLVYCWDGRPYRGLSVGTQGYLVRIPLAPDPSDGVLRPLTRGEARRDAVTGQLLNYVFRRVPVLPGVVTPIFDPVSGRVMLVTADRTNGNAVWVFDPAAERFVGVVTGGYPDQKKGNTAVGFDAVRGRVYLLTQDGLLIAPIRSDPLPAGLIYPVLVNTERREDFVLSNRIAVAPKLRRLFVAINDRNGDAPDHFAVLEDNVPDPPAVEPVDPDSLTSAVKEQEGRTAAATSGQAMASGAHLVNTGGLARAAGQNDPSCFFQPPNLAVTAGGSESPMVPTWEPGPALFGACPADVVVSPGHREAAAAASELAASTGGGATARAAAFAFGSNDTGTDGDLRPASDCGAGTPDQPARWGRRWPLPDDATLGVAGGSEPGKGDNQVLGGGQTRENAEQDYNARRDTFWDGVFGSDQFEDGRDDYLGGCNQVQDGLATGSAQSPAGPVDPRSGTKGADGRGFPVRAAACGDFGGTPASETWPSQAEGRPQAGYPTSSAFCDAASPAAQGLASAGALAVPSTADPQLSVARVSSKVTSLRTPDQGQVTVAFASASGVQIGPLFIAEVRSLAITKAAGRKGTTSTSLVRQLCGISVAGQEQLGCVDAASADVKDLFDELNAAVLQKVQLSVPQGATQATPKGYQAVVTKHPGQRAGDQTVNDDDSHTVSALQAIVYNDGPRGRSRLVVQLAGVHAESRYGIIELPNFSTGPEAPEPAPPDDGTDTGPAPTPQPEGQAPLAPAPDVFTPETFVEEGFTIEEVVRTNSGSPAPRFVSVPPAGSTPARIVRVPLQAVSDAINLLVQHPREFALLFVMFSLLATPAYLGLRRRSFGRALTAT